MILIGLGSNLKSAELGSPHDVLKTAICKLTYAGLRILDLSPLYRSAPVPASDQPWFVNGIARVETALAPLALLALLHRVEANMGRQRAVRWSARIIDLDLLTYKDIVIPGETENQLVLPHPRLAERAFVLAPLADLAPEWRHPVTGHSARCLLAQLPPGQVSKRVSK